MYWIFLPFIWNPIVIVGFSLRCTCCNALFWTTVNFLHASGIVYHDCLLVVVRRKLCCWCVMWNMLVVDEGWPRAFQACKKDGNRMGLGEDKKGSSRAKKRSLWFLDCICGRSCRIKSLQKWIIVVLIFPTLVATSWQVLCSC